LDKPARRETPLTADYVGFTIDNHFVIGYGLDYEERGRELSGVYVMEED
jgi:hypoxanthine phosphoribosyltransferase